MHQDVQCGKFMCVRREREEGEGRGATAECNVLLWDILWF